MKLEIQILDLLDRKKSTILLLSTGVLLIVTLIITITDWQSENDLMLSSNSLLNEENIQFEIRKNETKFRDQIFKNLDSLYSDNVFLKIDTIVKSSLESKEVTKYLILNKLKKGNTHYSFTVKQEKLTSPLIEVEGIIITFEIDFNKLDNIINSTKSDLKEDNIKYGNYLKTKYKFIKVLRYDYLFIGLFILIAILLLSYFVNKIGTKKKHNIENIIDELRSDQDAIKLAQEILNDDKINKKEIEQLRKLFAQIESNIKNYQFDNILDSILYIDVTKAERKSLELYNRSTLMLILGLLIAILGILVFYFTLPDFNSLASGTNYLSLTIRPTLILLFIQSIAFYLLKQYRLLINDYKYFYEEYLKKSQTFITHQLMQNDNLNKMEIKLIEKLLDDKKENSNPSNIDTDKIPHEKLLEVLKEIIEKFK